MKKRCHRRGFNRSQSLYRLLSLNFKFEFLNFWVQTTGPRDARLAKTSAHVGSLSQLCSEPAPIEMSSSTSSDDRLGFEQILLNLFNFQRKESSLSPVQTTISTKLPLMEAMVTDDFSPLPCQEASVMFRQGEEGWDLGSLGPWPRGIQARVWSCWNHCFKPQVPKDVGT